MPKYFQYLISPEHNHSSLLIALRVDNDTITGYFRASTLEYSAPSYKLSNIIKHFSYCTDKYKKNKGVHFFGILEQHEHLHSNPTEPFVAHMHLKHRKQIEIKTLRAFLRSFKQCEKEGLLPAGENFLTHQVCKDIIIKYEEFREECRKDTRENSKLRFIRSNNPFYNEAIIPKISTHLLLLEKSSPSAVLPPPEETKVLSEPCSYSGSDSASTYSAALAIGSLLIATAAVGFFRQCTRRPAKHSNEEIGQQPLMKIN